MRESRSSWRSPSRLSPSSRGSPSSSTRVLEGRRPEPLALRRAGQGGAAALRSPGGEGLRDERGVLPADPGRPPVAASRLVPSTGRTIADDVLQWLPGRVRNLRPAAWKAHGSVRRARERGASCERGTVRRSVQMLAPVAHRSLCPGFGRCRETAKPAGASSCGQRTARVVNSRAASGRTHRLIHSTGRRLRLPSPLPRGRSGPLSPSRPETSRHHRLWLSDHDRHGSGILNGMGTRDQRPQPGGTGITPAQSRAIARWFNSPSFAALPLAEQIAIKRRVTLTTDPWGSMTEAERAEALTAR